MRRFTCSVASALVAGPPCLAGTALEVDPLLVLQARTVWDVVAGPSNPIWPGWDASDTPLLFYLPDVQEVLINHPAPPERFTPYDGPLAFPGGDIVVADGETWISLDGQNTAREFHGVPTLVVADTRSNARQAMSGYATVADVPLSALGADPYGQMGMIAHEAFHVFQFRSAPDKGADERDARHYPTLLVENNVGFALEARWLEACIRAATLEEARAAGLRWLAVRQHRRSHLRESAIAYEDGNEFSEGLAMYVEWRLSEVLEGTPPPPDLWWATGFRGFNDLRHIRESHLARLRDSLRGDISINNDRFGMAPARFRLYSSGMAIALLLDRFAPGWHPQIFDQDESLTSLAAAALDPTADELRSSLETALAEPDVAALRDAKQRLADDGARDLARMLADVRNAPGMVIDWSRLGEVDLGVGFTPFGVRRVDDARAIYTLVPISANLGSRDYTFTQHAPLPTLEDVGRRQFRFPLRSMPTARDLESLLGKRDAKGWRIDGLELRLDDVTVRAARAQVRVDGEILIIEMLPTRSGP